MGTYLNPGNNDFLEAINSQIFVDKTEMLQYLNSLIRTKMKYVSVSRPRRFGKTIAADMLCAYYGQKAPVDTVESRELFINKKIAKCKPVIVGGKEIEWDDYIGKFDVIRIVMTDFMKKPDTIKTGLSELQKLVARDIVKKYPDVDFYDKANLLRTMSDVYAETGNRFVVIIDEWDSIFREYREDKDGQKMYLDFLRDWLKDKSYIALAYMTGILPIKKYGKHSALNMFTEYSMTFPRELAPYAGFTPDEVRELCTAYGRNYENIKDWYDGYEVSDIVPPDANYEHQKATGKELEAERYSLYSPYSVVNAVTTGVIKNYWNTTETYEALAEYIRINLEGLQDTIALLMDGARVSVNISGYQNDMTTFNTKDDVLTLLIHLGYLGFDDKTNEVFVPNKEILDEFKTSTQSEDWNVVFKALRKSQKLLEATWAGDEELVAQLVEDAHNEAGNRSYNDEAALSYAILMAYFAASRYYTIVTEFDSGKGYVDILFIPKNIGEHPVLLVELKYEQSAKTAMTQIKQQRYPQRLEHYKGNLLLVGINYKKGLKNTSPNFKHHTCKIERA